MYRPEGWLDILRKIFKERGLDATGKGHYVEAGADAYEEGLIKQPSNRGANVLYVDFDADSSTILHQPHRKGYLVFIPEE